MSVGLDLISQTQGETQDSTVVESWHNTLDPDIKSNESLKSFNSINDLAKSYVALSADYNSKAFVPSEGSSQDDRNKFYDTLGRPSDKKYLLTRKPEDESILSSYEELFFNSGLSKSQGEAILNKMYQVQEESSKTQKEHLEKVRHQNLGALFGKYGDTFDQKVRVAISAMDKYGSSDLAQVVEESNYNPAIIDMLIRVGETLQPENIVTSDVSHNIDTPEYALKEINRLENDNEFMQRYKDRRHEGHKSAVEKMDELYRQAYKR